MATRTPIALAVFVALAAVPVLAHDGHACLIMGTVTARDVKHLEVKTPGGENLSVAINTPRQGVGSKACTRDRRPR